MEETEKTLLQKIREKEQEYNLKLESVKKETDTAIDSARSDAESLICTADSAAKKEAEQIYWQEKGAIEAELEELKKDAIARRELAEKNADANLSRAAETIIRYVTTE